MSELLRNFTHVAIPAEIWLRKDISMQSKCLWAEIRSLHDKEKGGCWASDEYLMEFIGLKRTRLHELFKELKDVGLLEVVSFNGRQTVRRAIVPEVEYMSGQQVSGKADTSNPENRTPDVRKSGSYPYIENKEENKDMSEHKFGPITSYFFETLKRINPKLKMPNLEKWALQMKRFMEQDQRSEPEVREVIAYIENQHNVHYQDIDFTWSRAVISPEKLRKHFSSIWLEMKKKPSPKQAKENEQKATVNRIQENKQWLTDLHKRVALKISNFPHLRFSISDNLVWIGNGRIEHQIGYAEPAFKNVIEKFLKSENLL